jgi:hypothetical protein
MNIEHKLCQKLVSHFVSNPNWPREMALAKTLLSRCPDFDSWLSLSIGKLPSLAFFLTPDGEIFIPSSARNPFLLDFDKLRPKPRKSKRKIEKKIEILVS